MFSIRNRMILPIVLLAVVSAGPALAQTYDLSWHTIDGGGMMDSAGGAFALSGAIGQPDANSFAAPMTGGTFQLVGGFWPVASGVCVLPGDMNLDGQRDGQDVQLFVNCVLSVSGSNCVCGDFDESGSTTPADVSLFVSALLSV